MINTILILEDETPNAQRLKRMLGHLRPQARVLSVIETVSEAVVWFQQNPSPDVVMMDIRLADGLSFELFEKITLRCPIIFTTAYDEYAVKAFKYNSVDYLLKPIVEEELAAALGKLESQHLRQQPLPLEALLQQFYPKTYRYRFLLPYKDGYKALLVSDIAYFHSELKITRASLHGGKEEILPHTLEELEQDLDPKLFFRANRQYILHIDSIAQVFNYFNGKLKIELRHAPDLVVVVSRDKAGLFKKWMDF